MEANQLISVDGSGRRLFWDI